MDTSPAFSIDSAEPAEASECARLLVAQLAEHGIEASAEALAGVLHRVNADPRHGFVLVAKDSAGLIGIAYAATLLSAEHGGFVASLEELYVAPEYRQRGVGTALLAAVIKRAKEEGMTAIELEVEVGHRRAIPLYERFGFRLLDRSRWLKRL